MNELPKCVNQSITSIVIECYEQLYPLSFTPCFMSFVLFCFRSWCLLFSLLSVSPFSILLDVSLSALSTLLTVSAQTPATFHSVFPLSIYIAVLSCSTLPSRTFCDLTNSVTTTMNHRKPNKLKPCKTINSPVTTGNPTVPNPVKPQKAL